MVGLDAHAGLRQAPRTSARTRIRRGVAVGTAIVSLVAIGAGVSLIIRPPTIRGHVIDVVARDIGHAATVTIRDLDGVDHLLDVDIEVDMSPGHLREHMLFGEPVTVTLARRSDPLVRPLVVRITDGLE